MRLVILAAGQGKRLGYGLPKALIKLSSSGPAILDYQLKCFLRFFKPNEIIIVIGYKKDLFYNDYGGFQLVENRQYDITNTSKSLLTALDATSPDDIIWINGDVVCHPDIIENIAKTGGRNCVCVNTGRVGDEEIKYTLDADGMISGLSKTLKGGLGEAVGINRINKKDIPLFKECLSRCDNNDYFEKGMELAISKGMKFSPLEIQGKFCVEIDFQKDLDIAMKYISENPSLWE